MPVELHPNFRVAGSIPAGAANRLRSSVGRAERQFHNRLVVTPCKKQPRRMPDGTTATRNGTLREVRLLTLQALSGTSGTPEVSSPFCRRGDANTWRMQAGLQVARPPKGGRSGVQITLPLCGAGWRSHRLANSCRQPIEQGECLREYIGIWRFESARRSSIDRFPASTCRRPREER